MNRVLFSCLALLLALFLVACSAPKPLPDFRYYRLPEPVTPHTRASSPLQLPLVVESIRADGVRGERPILYSSANDALKLLQYHYQLWVDPPGSLVQRRLLDRLSEARIAPLVTDRLSPRDPLVRVTGSLRRFERVSRGAGWTVVVSMQLRAEMDGAALPLFDRRFEQTREVADDLGETVTAFAECIDAIALELTNQLSAAAASLSKP